MHEEMEIPENPTKLIVWILDSFRAFFARFDVIITFQNYDEFFMKICFLWYYLSTDIVQF